MDRTEPIFLRRSLWAASSLPEFISEDGDVFLPYFLSGNDDDVVGFGLLLQFQ